MSFFKRLFGNRSSDGQVDPPVSQDANRNPADDPDMIKVFDGYGRELYISRETWKNEVLPGALQEARNSPELYSVIAGALSDGLAADVVKYAEHLRRSLRRARNPRSSACSMRSATQQRTRAHGLCADSARDEKAATRCCFGTCQESRPVAARASTRGDDFGMTE
jgi:hypothetical protein